MSTKDPLDQFLEKVNDILKLVQESKDTGKEIPKEVEEQLQGLELLVTGFVHMNEETLKSLGVSENMVADDLDKLQQSTARTNRSLSKLERVKKEVDLIQKKFAVEVAKGKSQKKVPAEKKIQSRKKKFRQMGGKKDWKPL